MLVFSRLHTVLVGAACVGVAVIGLSAGASPTIASAFYNKSESGHPATLPVRFRCGVFCGTTWSIPVGQSRAYPGKGGDFAAGASSDWNISSLKGKVACPYGQPDEVTDHGGAELHYRSDAAEFGFVWKIYNNTEQLTESAIDLIDAGEEGPQTGSGCTAL